MLDVRFRRRDDDLLRISGSDAERVPMHADTDGFTDARLIQTLQPRPDADCMDTG